MTEVAIVSGARTGKAVDRTIKRLMDMEIIV